MTDTGTRRRGDAESRIEHRTPNVERPTSNGRTEALIAEARSWIGTPFMHAARVKGVGVDCGGVIVASAQAVGIPVGDKVAISPSHVDSAGLVRHILRYADEVAIADRQPGDVLLFNVHSNPQHLGLMVTDRTFVHAYQSASKVCETELAPVWIRQLVGVYRIREANRQVAKNAKETSE